MEHPGALVATMLSGCPKRHRLALSVTSPADVVQRPLVRRPPGSWMPVVIWSRPVAWKQAPTLS